MRSRRAIHLVILSRGHAAEALASTGRMMAKLGLVLNETKTAMRDARRERFDFLGYSFGPHHYRKDAIGIGSQSVEEERARLKAKVSDILVRGNIGAWSEVRDRLNCLLRGWSTYFGYGTRLPAYRVVDNHVYDRVRNFPVRRHKVPSHGTRRFPTRGGVWHARSVPPPARPFWTAAVCLAGEPVEKPDAGNPHVRFDERCALQAR